MTLAANNLRNLVTLTFDLSTFESRLHEALLNRRLINQWLLFLVVQV